jgi:hypothetical protein
MALNSAGALSAAALAMTQACAGWSSAAWPAASDAASGVVLAIAATTAGTTAGLTFPAARTTAEVISARADKLEFRTRLAAFAGISSRGISAKLS